MLFGRVNYTQQNGTGFILNLSIYDVLEEQLRPVKHLKMCKKKYVMFSCVVSFNHQCVSDLW